MYELIITEKPSAAKKIAEAFPPTTEEESKMIDKISRNIWAI